MIFLYIRLKSVKLFKSIQKIIKHGNFYIQFQYKIFWCKKMLSAKIRVPILPQIKLPSNFNVNFQRRWKNNLPLLILIFIGEPSSILIYRMFCTEKKMKSRYVFCFFMPAFLSPPKRNSFFIASSENPDRYFILNKVWSL